MNIAFYSYKGGVGRTQLVANLANYLFLYENKKILLMDWDLEAPGLHFYFPKPNEERNFLNEDFDKKGLIELLNDYVILTREKNPWEITNKEQMPHIESKNIVSIAKNAETGAKIDLFPAGIYQNFKEYRRKVIDLDWREFYDRLDGSRYLEYVIKPQLKELGYDFVLIDSRTGISDYQNISNIQMVDANLIVIAPNMQNLEGCVEVAQSIIQSPYIAEGRRQAIVMPVLSRAEEESPDFKEFDKIFREKTNFIIQELAKHLPIHLKEDEYYEKTRLFYNKYTAIGEHALFIKNENRLSRFQEVFKSIADYLLLAFMVETKDIQALASLSDQKRYEKDFISAEKALLKAIEIEATNSAIIHKLVSFYQQRSQTESALNWIEKGLIINENDEILKSGIEIVLRSVKSSNIEKAIRFIEEVRISEYFEFMDSLGVKSADLKRLEREFIHGKNGYDYYDRLMVFTQSVLKETNDSRSIENSNVSLKNLYNTLNQKLNDESLSLFCMLHFEAVYNNFTVGQSKTSKIASLLDYAKRNELFEKLEQDLQEF